MAIIFTPGQVVAAPDWDAMFQQHGGAKSNQIRTPSKAEQDAADTSGDDLEQNPIYRYYGADGSYVEARRAPNGDYLIVDYKPSAQFTQTQSRPAAAAGHTTQIEGTPLPGGGFDNERPVKVTRDANGKQIGQAVPLTGKELQDWHDDRQRSRNPGRKTDAEIQAEQRQQQQDARQNQPTTIRVPVDGHPGVSMVTEKNPQTGVSDTYYVNAQGQRIPQPAAAPSYTATQRVINGQTFTVVTKTPKDGSQPTITNYGPDGKSVAALPAEGREPLPDGMPPLDTSSAAAARSSYAAQVKWAQEQIAKGGDREKIIAVLTPSWQAAEAAIKDERERIEDARATRTQDIQQEGNRLSAATSQFANSRLGVDEIGKFAPVGGNQAGTAYLTNLLTQQLMNSSTRGNVGPASPTPAPLTAPSALPAAVQNAAAAAGVTPSAATQPNALGVGNIGAVRAPGSLPTPLLRPQPVTAPVQAAPLPAAVQNAAAAAGVGAPPPAIGPAAGVSAPEQPQYAPVHGASQTADPQSNFGPPTFDPSTGPDPNAPPVGMVDPSTMPLAIQRAYGRSIIDEIMRQQQGMVA